MATDIETRELTINTLARRENYLQQRNRLVLLVGFRLLIITALLISTMVVHSHASGDIISSLVPLYTVAAAFFLANLIYTILFRFKAPFNLQATLQLTGDLMFAAVILHYTGGVQSAFSLFYILVAINGAVILQQRRAVIVATAAVICYLTQIVLQYFNILQPYSLMSGGNASSVSFLNAALVHTFAIYATCILTLFLAEQAQKAHHTAVEIRHDLSQLKELHLSVIQNLPVGVITLDSDSTVVLINSLAAPMLNGQVEIGAKLTRLFDLPLENFQEGHVVAKKSPDGEQALLVRFSPLRHNDDLLGNIITLQDVTPVQKMERELHQKERLAAVGELSAGMAHEIRNPLASIRGSIEILSKRTAKDQAEQRLMNIAVREIDRLNHLITDFLTYTRPQQLVLTMVDVRQLCQETANFLQTDLPAKIQVSIDGDNPGLIEADEAKLKQVFWNLLKNGVDACLVSSNESNHIAITFKQLAAEVVITVTDDGPGIPDEVMTSLFVPFYSTKSQGSGLGLTIIRRIVEDHHGRIEVKSTLGQGSSFYLTLPVRQQTTNLEGG